MKLNLNSNSAKLYRWFYGKEYMPSNLCPYFWKLVIAYIFALPLLVLTIPHILLCFFGDDYDYINSIGSRLVLSVFTYAGLYLAMSMFSPIMLFFIKFPKHGTTYLHDFIIQGFCMWAIAIVFGIWYIVKVLYERSDSKTNEENDKIMKKKSEEKPNIVIEMIKAKYNKYCPKIDWE